jgi:20S proteasome alpha/beta subunit
MIILYVASVLIFLVLSVVKGYDQTTLQFHPSGVVKQVEYAKEAVRMKGGPIISVATDDGVVIVTIPEKERSKDRHTLEIQGSHRGKVHFLDDNEELVLTVTGLGSDASALADAAKRVVSEYRASYDCTIAPKALASGLADILHSQTRRKGSRPLAVAAAVVGYDEDMRKPQLFVIDTSGGCESRRACFLGGGERKGRKGLAGHACVDAIMLDVEEAIGDGGFPTRITEVYSYLQGRIKARYGSDNDDEDYDEDSDNEGGDGDVMKDGDEEFSANIGTVRVEGGGGRGMSWRQVRHARH